jgi:multidrug transporter EmrE-like cation transporter
MAWIILVVAVCLVAFAQVTFKTAVQPRSTVRLAIALGLFGVAQLGFFLALRDLDVGMVYMATGITHVLVLGLSWRWLGESLEARHVVAGALIIAGMAVYGLG